jgi:hypothetical protein
MSWIAHSLVLTPHLVVSATPLYIGGITTLMTLIILVTF